MPLRKLPPTSRAVKPSAGKRPARRQRATRRRSARDLLSVGQLQESLLVAAPPSVQNASIAGMQAALSILIALASMHLSPWPHLVGFPALGALAALFGRYASVPVRRRIVLICGSLLTAGVLVPSLVSYAGAPPGVMVLLLALSAGAFTIAVSHLRLGGPGAVIFVFAVGAVMGPVETWQTVLERTVATAWGATLAWFVCMLTDRLRSQEVIVPGTPPTRHPPFSHQLIAAARITVGAAISAWVAYTAGWQYPAWAAIGATAVMQGPSLHVTMNRSLQRMAGTVVGACIVWAILVQEPSFWVVVSAIVLFQFITEVIIGYNYALGQIAITPMALLMTYLVSPTASSNMPVERVMDTIVGAALGILFAVLFSTVDDRAYLARRRRKLDARR